MLTRSDFFQRELGFFLRLAATIAVLFVAGLRAQTTAEPLLQEANTALVEGDYAAAAAALETYLAQQPEDYRAEFNLAFAYSMTGRRGEAIRHYKNVLSREKGLTAAHLNLGILLLQEGNAAEAVDHFRPVVKERPRDVSANLYLAEALTSAGRSPEAREAYEQVLKLKPDHVPALLAYAELMEETDPAAAEEHLRRALLMDTSLEEARLSLAALLEARAAEGADTLGEAAEIYRQYLETHPDRSDLRWRLGQIYALQKRFSAATEQFEAARAAGDTSLELAKELLQTYLEGQETEKAEALLREMLSQDEGNAEWRLLYGRLRMDKKQYREAVEQFLRVTELRPQWVEGYTNLASALYLLKNYEATVKALEPVAALQQDTAGTYFLRAISLDKLHVLQPALENYQRFLELDAGRNPDQEFQARQRIKVLLRELK